MTEDGWVIRAFPPLLAALGASQLALGLLMVIAPGTFFEDVGPFGTRNDHYLADVATLYLALGAVLLAARRPSWRVPVLAFAAVQYGLHSLNHLIDVGAADPSWLGPVDLVALALGTLLFGWLVAVAWGAETPR
jgi:hypothetical protein